MLEPPPVRTAMARCPPAASHNLPGAPPTRSCSRGCTGRACRRPSVLCTRLGCETAGRTAAAPVTAGLQTSSLQRRQFGFPAARVRSPSRRPYPSRRSGIDRNDAVHVRRYQRARWQGRAPLRPPLVHAPRVDAIATRRSLLRSTSSTSAASRPNSTRPPAGRSKVCSNPSTVAAAAASSNSDPQRPRREADPRDSRSREHERWH